VQSAAAKGLIAGAITINMRDGSSHDLFGANGSMLIVSMEGLLSVDMQNVKWILVVEKEV